MWAAILLAVGLVIGSTSQRPDPYACLPQSIKLPDVVSVQGPTHLNARKITVEDTLKALEASCRAGKPVDAKGQEIYFFRLVGCWGNPPADYKEILERQDRELARLKKQYRVIEMTCNPSGDPIS
jgi:hypothetical protein